MATFRPHGSATPVPIPLNFKFEMAAPAARTQGVKVSDVAGELAGLAVKCGVVANEEAFHAWLAYAPRAARKALFGRVAAQRAAAPARTAPANKYPAGWLRAGVRPTSAAAAPSKQYPSGWLRAAGVGGRRGRITEGND